MVTDFFFYIEVLLVTDLLPILRFFAQLFPKKAASSLVLSFKKERKIFGYRIV